MLIAAVAFALLACIERSDPTDPGAPGTPTSPSGVITVAVRLPVTSLEVGKAVSAAATPMNEAGQAIPSAPVAWSSSDTSIVAVSSAGLVSARKMGTATIYATSEGVAGQSPLTVTDSVPASVVVSPASATATVGGHVQLSASVSTHTGRALPGHTVSWTSTDTRYATVSTSGVVTGAGAGTAKIVAIASGVGDTAVVSVAPAAIANLSVTPGTYSLTSGTTTQLTAHATDASGNTLTGRSVGWSTSDATVASVSTSGIVTGTKVGTATITATSEGKSAAATIRVTAGSVSRISITPGSIGLVAGSTRQLTVSLTDAAGNPLAAQPVTWSTSSTSVATVTSAGVVTGVHTGSATIHASLNGATGSANAAVSAGAVQNVSVAPASTTIATGGTKQFTATLTDASGNVLTGAVAWSSSNTAVATINSSGLVTGVHSGSTTITAAAGGASDNSALTVTAGAVNTVSVSPGSVSLLAGATQQLTAAVTDASGSPISGQTITWSSSNSSVVSINSSGLATAAHTGSATITASTGGKSGTSLFSVSVGPVNSVAISPASGSVQEGKTLQLTATLSDVAGNTVTGRTITWTSSATSVATVTSSGLVSGIVAGSANITATADGKSKSAAITVTAATVVAPPPAPPPPPPPPPPTGGVQAVWSDNFVNSVGVATHFTYWDLLPYGNNLNSTLASIQNGGFRFIRDGLSVDTDAGSNNRYWGTLKQITQMGIKLVLVTQPVYLGNQTWVQAPYANQSNLDTAVSRIGAAGILAFEGPNEVDNNNNFWGGIPAYGANTKAYMAAMYAHSKAIAPSITVIGLTTTSAYGSSFIGDISSYMDAGTLHPYPGGQLPTSALASTISNSSVLNAAHKPWWVTETGYYTSPNATVAVYQPGVSEAAQGKYAGRIYLDYFRAGISHTSVYEIADEHVDLNNAEANYGLLHNDGTPKPAYTALKNLLGLLADPGGTYSAGSLAYTLTGATSTIRQSLFQKRDGRFYLVLWNDVLTYNTSSKTNITNPTVPVTVTLDAPHSISVYQPYTQAAAMSAASSASSITVNVPDHPLVIEINP